MTFENREHSLIRVTGYGDLNKIFVLTLASDAFFTSLSSKMLILALITPWNTEGKDATLENTYLLSRRAPIVTDVRSLKAIVGLVPIGKRWGIVDRTAATSTRYFTDMETWGGTSESETDMEEVDEFFYKFV